MYKRHRESLVLQMATPILQSFLITSIKLANQELLTAPIKRLSISKAAAAREASLTFVNMNMVDRNPVFKVTLQGSETTLLDVYIRRIDAVLADTSTLVTMDTKKAKRGRPRLNPEPPRI